MIGPGPTSIPPPGPVGAEVPAEPAPRWGPGRVAGGVGALLGASIVEAGVVAIFDPDLESLAAKLVLQALLAVTLVAVAFTVSAGDGRSTAAPGSLGLRMPGRKWIGLALLAYLAYLVFAYVYASLTGPEQEDLTRDLGLGEGVLGAIAAGLLIVAAAPISEEIFFRGFIFGGLRNRLSFALAGPISAVVFGIFHYTGPDSWAVLPQLAFLGLVLAYVYEHTGSLVPTIAIHALNNALAFAILSS